MNHLFFSNKKYYICPALMKPFNVNQHKDCIIVFYSAGADLRDCLLNVIAMDRPTSVDCSRSDGLVRENLNALFEFVNCFNNGTSMATLHYFPWKQLSLSASVEFSNEDILIAWRPFSMGNSVNGYQITYNIVVSLAFLIFFALFSLSK